jgi:hypothetical protein
VEAFQRKSLLAISLFIAVGLSVTLIFVTPIYLMTETLQVGEPEHVNGQYTFVAYDQLGHDIVHITFTLSNISEVASKRLTSARIIIWHSETTHIDSLQAIFELTTALHSFNVYLDPLCCGQWDVKITEPRGDRCEFQFPQLGREGVGTVVLNFMVQKSMDLPSVRITTDVWFHDTTFPSITQQHAHASIEIP